MDFFEKLYQSVDDSPLNDETIPHQTFRLDETYLMLVNHIGSHPEWVRTVKNPSKRKTKIPSHLKNQLRHSRGLPLGFEYKGQWDIPLTAAQMQGNIENARVNVYEIWYITEEDFRRLVSGDPIAVKAHTRDTWVHPPNWLLTGA